MGRGRAKAKQAKVARELKYNSGGMTDLERLRQELIGSPSTTVEESSEPDAADDADDESDDYDDPYADLYDDEDGDEGRDGKPGDRSA